VAPPPALLDRDALAARPRDVLILGGEHDEIAPAAALEEIAQELPRGRFVRIVEADHFFVAGLADVGREITKWLGGE
jgi:alpha/beta superfamily hydrolase